MKKYLIVALVALSVITAFGFLIHQNKKLRRERDAYHNNTEVLLSEVERYQTKSGEQAVRVGELQLRVAELERQNASPSVDLLLDEADRALAEFTLRLEDLDDTRVEVTLADRD